MDADGDVVSMTTTVESVFGSGRTVGGFVLNNQLTDFSYLPIRMMRGIRPPMPCRVASVHARRCHP